MKKDAHIYISLGLLAIGVFLAIYYLNVGPTGFAIIEEYTNESACVEAGYVWENLTEQNCTVVTTCINGVVECEPCLGYEDINGTQGDCIEWSSCEEEVCTDEETCEEIIIGGQCIGDVCDTENFELCLTQEECEDEFVGGFWYDANDDETLTCNVNPEPACSNDFTLCNEENCTSEGGGYWYDDVCNEYECATDEQCSSEYECVSGDCIQIVVSPITEDTTESEPTPVEQPQIQEQPRVPITALTADNIQNVKLVPGESKDISWNVMNSGETFLKSCTFASSGEFSEMISFDEEERGINPGDETTFSFLIEVSGEMEDGQYPVSVSVECTQKSISKDFVIEIEAKKLDFQILSVDRTRQDRVRIIYSLEELTGESQDVELKFYIKDLENVEVSNVSENKSLAGDTLKDFRTYMSINESLEGNLTFVANFNSEVYSSSVMEPIVLGAPMGGFAIFEGIGTGGIILLVVVVIVLLVIFLVARKIRTSRKKFKEQPSKKKD